MKKQNFIVRFYIYQKERFPFLSHGILISVFTFSAISYSRLSAGISNFIPIQDYLLAIFNTITLFFLLRVSDEHKDAEDDLKYRKYLPVPRGIIQLRELRYVAYIIIILQIALQAYLHPIMLIPYAAILVYMYAMLREFWVAEWLKKHQFWYVISHMWIIPFVDVYASGYDWILGGREAPVGLLLFFAVSFCNGVVLEIGRKIKAPHLEEPGVVSYSGLMGKKAPWIWYLILVATGILASLAAYFAHLGMTVYLVFSVLIICNLIPVILFQKRQDKFSGKWIEHASGIWTILMYLTLGAAPMMDRLFL
ncbi:MAG: hypothetical protein KG003_11175 [Bacteroidetes bacterium]|nr:hypothetical protein [Bacteroidota bacterium]